MSAQPVTCTVHDNSPVLRLTELGVEGRKHEPHRGQQEPHNRVALGTRQPLTMAVTVAVAVAVAVAVVVVVVAAFALPARAKE